MVISLDLTREIATRSTIARNDDESFYSVCFANKREKNDKNKSIQFT